MSTVAVLIARPLENAKDALAYENVALVERFAKEKQISIQEAQTRFQELKKFLVVCGVTDQPCAPSGPMDEIWHYFILHTRDYADFCEKYVGNFVHHFPSDQPHVTDASVSRREQDMIAVAMKLFGSVRSDMWKLKSRWDCADCEIHPE